MSQAVLSHGGKRITVKLLERLLNMEQEGYPSKQSHLCNLYLLPPFIFTALKNGRNAIYGLKTDIFNRYVTVSLPIRIKGLLRDKNVLLADIIILSEHPD